jgi:stress response protein YsnF
VTSDSKVPSSDNNISSNKDEVVSPINTVSQQQEEIVERIPIYKEDYTISKEVTKTQLHLEKKWINSTKKIEIPTKYEEMFINGRELNSYTQNELVEVFSKIKEKISEAIHPEKNEKDGTSNNSDVANDNTKQYPNDLDIKLKGNEDITRENKDSRALQLIKDPDNETDENQIQGYNNISNITGEDEEQVIPLWGEEIIIDKKIVKIGEITIKKSKISENRMIDVEVRNEKVTVDYPDGNKEEIAGF